MTDMDDDPNILRSKCVKFEYPICSIGEYLYKKLKKYQDRTLLICANTGDSYTGNEIIKRAETIANSLLKHGITKDDMILFHSNNNVPYVMTQIAAFFLGNTITGSPPNHKIFEIKNQLNDTGATIVFSSVKNAPVVKEAMSLLDNPNQVKLKFLFDGQYEDFIPFNVLMENYGISLNQIPHFSVNPENDNGVIYYTSGTTGLAKGTMITHFGFVAYIYAFKKTNIYHRNSIISGHYQFGHCTGTILNSLIFAIGSTEILIEEPDLEVVLSSIEKYKISEIILFPAFTAMLVNEDISNKYDISSVKYMLVGGSPIPKHFGKILIEKYKLLSFKDTYGLTEGIPCSFQDQNFVPGDCSGVGPNMEIKIVDLCTKRSLPKNCDGEICFRGPAMFKGYLNNPEATASTIDEHGWLHTGDVGHYNDEGHIFITDRIKEMIRFRDFNVYPAEIEDCLMRHEAIHEAVVIGIKHKTDGEWIRAYVIPKKGKEISGKEIDKYMSDRMACHKRLRAGVVFIDSIPRSSIGKVNRQYYKDLTKNEMIVEEY